MLKASVYPRTRHFGAALLVLFLAALPLFAQNVTFGIPLLKPGAALPKRYTAQGKSLSPPLAWSGLPNDTKELAVVFEDVDRTRVHWVLYSIPAKVVSLPEGIPRDEMLSEPSKLVGTIQGITDFKGSGPGYIAPVYEPGSPHRYQFTLYALDAKLGLQPGLDKASLLLLLQGHILGKGEFVVTSGKK